MGVDLIHKQYHNSARKDTKSDNVYLELLIKLYRFLARRSGCKFNEIVLKRLYMSNINTPPVSLSTIARHVGKEGNQGKTVVIVGKVLNDERLAAVPAMTVCALSFSETARNKIISAGGSVLTFDMLAKVAPTGKNTILLQGKRTARTANKYFGRAPGLPGSHTRVRTQYKGNKYEKVKNKR